MRLAQVLAALLCACGPVAGVTDAGPLADAAEASAPLDAPVDAPAEASAPEAAGSDVVARDALRCTTDMDGDGYIWVECGGDDCDDRNARVHPGQLPHCDRELGDSDCNGTLDSMEALRQNMRCVREYPVISGDMSGSSAVMILCGANTRPPQCRACRTGQPCRCWSSGAAGSSTCAP